MGEDRPTREELLETPIRRIDLSMERSISELVDSFSSTSFQARRLAQCVDVYRQMLDEGGSFTIFVGMSGALIAAGLRKILADMIRLRLVDVIVTTGAVIYQDYYQSMGHSHFRGKPDSDDVLLHRYMIDRIYDTYVDEKKFRQIDMDIGRIMDKKGGRRYSTREFLHSLGERCVQDGESILGNARKGGIPIYCPAIADSSTGIGLSTSYRRQREAGVAPEDIFVIDTIRDNYEMAQIVNLSDDTGAIYLGGGVPKNYINDSIVMADMMFDGEFGHKYAFQVTMDRPEWGGLSGSTLGEAQSWGKIDEKATHAMCHIELSVALPLIAGAVFERRKWHGRVAPSFRWEGDRLMELG